MMQDIRAFVGHSFTADDADVVGKFLKFFDQLAALHPQFSWQHAEGAEPKFINEKVLSLLGDKNVFIGICTRKERAVPIKALSKTWFMPRFLKAAEIDFEWKTSDWIIQEIGLATGLGLTLILFIESGLRSPGGIQGNVEYIPFDRGSPEISFGKLLEMVKAISPKNVGGIVSSIDIKSTPGEIALTSESPIDDSWRHPKPTWTRREYEFALFHELLIDGVDSATISDAYRLTDGALTDDNWCSWEAYGEFIRLTFAIGGSLDKLKTLTANNPKSSRTWEHLAKAYEIYDDYKSSAKAFEVAADLVSNDVEERRLLHRAATAHAKAGTTAAATAIIKKMVIKLDASEIGEADLLKALCEVSEVTKEDEVTVASMERLLELNAADINTRFNLAYKHSQIGNKDLALLHYLKIPFQERSAATWNNLGVEYDHFSLPGKSVSAYRTATGMNETLAMSNLAEKLISTGFLSEAQSQCDAALAIKDYHKNVSRSLARLKDVPDQEEKKETELIEKAARVSAFYKIFGKAILQVGPTTLAEHWQGPDCALKVTFAGSTFHATGSYERPAYGLSAGILSFGSFGAGSEKNSTVQFQIEFGGKMRGRAIEGYVSRKRNNETPVVNTLLGSTEGEPTVLMVLNDSGSELLVMEKTTGSEAIFYLFKS